MNTIGDGYLISEAYFYVDVADVSSSLLLHHPSSDEDFLSLRYVLES